MAQTVLRLNQESLRFVGLLVMSVLLVAQKGDAFQFKVGGAGSWTCPTDPNAAVYNQWAEKSRFQIGDTILFVYDGHQDSVFRVSKDDYANCNTESPLEKFTDGHTLVKLDQSGPHYFISGVADHCRKNQKLVVVVMADRSKHSSPPSPSPEAEVPPPSPAPSGEQSPSPPPSGEESPAPSDHSAPPKKKNAASSVAASSVVGTVAAAFVASTFVM